MGIAKGNSPLPAGGISPIKSSLSHHALGQLGAEHALVIFGHQHALCLVAFVEERQAEGEADVAEDFGVLRPCDDSAGAHHGRDVAVDTASL